MKLLKTVFNKIKQAKNWFLKLPLVVKLIAIGLVLGIGFFTYSKINSSQKNQIQYQTATVQKGTLINTISGSGSITSGNYTNINTRVSGVVKKVYVTNGDTVVKGQKIAEVVLDDYAKERQTAAWLSYLEATEAVKDAQTAKWTTDIQMWNDRETLLGAITNYNNNTGNTEGERQVIIKTVDQKRAAFAASELKYKNANASVADAQAKVSAALRNYQENSATIIAPSDGVVSDFGLAEGILVSASATTSSTSGATIVSAQTVGKINNPKGQLIASVSLSEIDVVNVKANQKVSLTLDAYSDKTFTGKVLAVNTSGTVNSGVTSYPVTILLDPVSVDIYPNMGVNAQIITFIKSDVLLIPSLAVTTTSNQSTVQIKKDGQTSIVQVEIGNSNDSEIEIISGLNEGDEVITSVITPQSTNQSNTSTSPFSGIGRTSGSSTSRGSEVRFFQGGPGGF